MYLWCMQEQSHCPRDCANDENCSPLCVVGHNAPQGNGVDVGTSINTSSHNIIQDLYRTQHCSRTHVKFNNPM